LDGARSGAESDGHMSRICSVCSHPQRAEIDRAAIAGASYRAIAHQFTVSRDALMRHKADHLLAELVKAQQAEEVSRATDLLAMALQRDEKALALLSQAEKTGDLKTAGQMLRISLVSLELLARLRGELNEQATVNILVAPEWIAVREALLRALWPFVEARTVVAAALAELEEASHNQTSGALLEGENNDRQLV
jgi:hypothetical protein